MEREELLTMLKLYKNMLADAQEQLVINQAVVSKQNKMLADANQTISNLEKQIVEMSTEVTVSTSEDIVNPG